MLSMAGKKPSEAKTASFAPSQALFNDISQLSTRLVLPPEIPKVLKSFAITIAFLGWLCYNNEAVYRDVNSIVYVLLGHKTCNTIDYVFSEV